MFFITLALKMCVQLPLIACPTLQDSWKMFFPALLNFQPPLDQHIMSIAMSLVEKCNLSDLSTLFTRAWVFGIEKTRYIYENSWFEPSNMIENVMFLQKLHQGISQTKCRWSDVFRQT